MHCTLLTLLHSSIRNCVDLLYINSPGKQLQLFFFYMVNGTRYTMFTSLTFPLRMPSGPMTFLKMCFSTCESTALSGSSSK